MTASEPDEVFLVAVVEMAPGQEEAGHRYEDSVLAVLARHGGTVERRLRSSDAATEVQLIRFRTRAGLQAALADPDRLAYRDRLGDAVPQTRVIEVHEV